VPRAVRRLVVLATVVAIVAAIRAAMFAVNDRSARVKPAHDDSSSA
jgi:hypothetical protein